ncbi:MAG: peptidoglycan editing factor PgeF [Rudaea sp.]|nr:peptidoglycan editing factor PgeF [Rudaea sp.]
MPTGVAPAVADSGAWVVPVWPAPASVHALTTTRLLPGNSQAPFDAFNLGLRSGEDAGIVLANRALLGRACALPAPPRWLRQVHGNRSLRLTAEALDAELEADAAFTAQPGVVLAILTADCLPILVCADDGTEIAAVHAGWRGLANGVVESCLGRLRSAPEKLLAWLGPAIAAVSYEVGDEVREIFVNQAPSARLAFSVTRAGHWHCDLYTLARQRLAALGVTRIHGGGFDTFTDARFYSYRRDGVRSGRFASLIWIGP